MVLNYCFYDFDVLEIFDNVKYVKDVHAKLWKKICEDYSLEKQELIEIGTLTQNDVDERAKAYMVKKHRHWLYFLFGMPIWPMLMYWL